MKKYFYKVVEIWAKYPFSDEIEERYVEFYELGKKKPSGKRPLLKLNGLRMDSATSIKDKEDYLKTQINPTGKFTIQKIK